MKSLKITINCVGSLEKLSKILSFSAFKRLEIGEIIHLVVLLLWTVPLVTSRILDVYFITALSLLPNSVLIASNTLLLAGLKS